jgi:hypothetical protein
MHARHVKMGGVTMPRIFVLLLSTLPLLWSCTTNMSVSEYGNPSSERKVLIAGEGTAYKRQLAAETIRILGTEKCYFRILGLDRLEALDTAPYQAVVLLAGYRAGRLDERVKRFLKGNPTNQKVILFLTRGTDDPMPQSKMPDVKVDSISSASRMDGVEMRADQLAVLIRERL